MATLDGMIATVGAGGLVIHLGGSGVALVMLCIGILSILLGRSLVFDACARNRYVPGHDDKRYDQLDDHQNLGHRVRFSNHHP